MKQLLVLAFLCTGVSAAQSQSSGLNPEAILISQGKTIYPPLAKTARVTGEVTVEFVVNRAGDVVSAMAVSGPPMLCPAAVDAVITWKFRMPKSDSTEEQHLETILEYRLVENTLRDSPPVVFDSYHHVILAAQPVSLSDDRAFNCPDFKKLPPLGTNENAAFVELSRANCYVDWANPGVTQLMRASSQPDTGKVRQLLGGEASVRDADSHGWTPLMYAAVHGDPSVLRALLAAGADANQSSLLGNTAMMLAASAGYFRQDLVTAGAMVNAQNAAGTTTLMILASQAGPREISAALKAGADASFQDKENRTALDYLHLAHCDRNPIREEPFSQSVPVQNSCAPLNEDSVKTERLLQSAKTASANAR